MTNIKDIPDDVLIHEVNRRAAEKKAIEEAIRREREEKERVAKEKLIGLIRTNIDVFLEFAPDHSYSSCNDDHHVNSGRECTRCTLLDLKREGPDGWFDYDSLKVRIDLRAE